MAKMREIKRRIRSVENTRQITKTMEMVATAKIKRAQERIEAARPYAFKMMEVLGHVARDAEAVLHPLLTVHEPTLHTVILALTSDRGLCGAFNANVIRATETILPRERTYPRRSPRHARLHGEALTPLRPPPLQYLPPGRLPRQP